VITHVEGTDTIFISGAWCSGVFTLNLKSRWRRWSLPCYLTLHELLYSRY
jgi:hypothetical protein